MAIFSLSSIFSFRSLGIPGQMKNCIKKRQPHPASSCGSRPPWVGRLGSSWIRNSRRRCLFFGIKIQFNLITKKKEISMELQIWITIELNTQLHHRKSLITTACFAPDIPMFEFQSLVPMVSHQLLVSMFRNIRSLISSWGFPLSQGGIPTIDGLSG